MTKKGDRGEGAWVNREYLHLDVIQSSRSLRFEVAHMFSREYGTPSAARVFY